jgi:hypothetical protein
LFAEGNAVLCFALEGIKSVLLLHPDFGVLFFFYYFPETLCFFASLMEGEDYLAQMISNFASFLGR